MKLLCMDCQTVEVIDGTNGEACFLEEENHYETICNACSEEFCNMIEQAKERSRAKSESLEEECLPYAVSQEHARALERDNPFDSAPSIEEIYVPDEDLPF